MLINIIKKHYVILIIMIAASILRLYGIMDRGLILWDSYLYANIAKTPIYILKYFFEFWNDLSSLGMIQYIKENGCVFFGEKPGHTFLIFVSFLIFGIKEWAVLFPMALCGIFSIYMVYLTGARFFSKETGIISAIILGFSGLQIGFSRTGFPQTDTMLMATLVLYSYLSYKETKKIKTLYICGLLMSIGTFFHHSYLLVIIPIIADFFIDYFRSKKNRPTYKELLKLSILVFSPLIIEELVFYVASLLYDDIVPGSIMAFFQKKQMFEGAGKSASYQEGLKFYYNIIKEVDGFLWVNLYVLALVFCVYKFASKRESNTGILLCQFLLPMFFWPWKYPTIKAITVSYPALSLLVGISVYNILKTVKNKKTYMIVYTVIIVAILLNTNISFIQKQLNMKTQYRYVLKYTQKLIKEDGGFLTAENQKNWTMILKFLIPLISDDSKGTVIKNTEDVEYKIIDYRQMFSHPDYVDAVKKQGIVVLKVKTFDRLLPIYHYHRLKLKQYEYLENHFDEEWLYVYLYKIKLQM